MASNNYSILIMLIIACQHVSIGSASESVGQQLRSMDHFKLSSTVKMVDYNLNKPIVAKLRLHEHYSNSHRRTKLIVDGQRIEGGPIEYYYDEISQELVRFRLLENGLKQCESAPRLRLFQDLFHESFFENFYKETVAKLVPGHIIGYARFLLLVDSAMESFQDLDRTTKIRNHEVKHYSASNQYGASTIDVFFGTQGDEIDLVGGRFPVRIEIKLKNNHGIIIDYNSIGPMGDYDQLSATTEGVHLNLFSLPLGLGCSQTLVRDKYGTFGSKQVVSFKMQLTRHDFDRGQSVSLGHRFYAYDYFARALRIDTYGPIVDGYSISIFNFQTFKRYLISGSNLNDKSMPSDTKPVEFDRQINKDFECHSTDLLKDFGKLYFRLVHLETMSDMGFAQVRGIKTRVFEKMTQNLPEILFPNWKYIHIKGAAVINEIIGSDDSNAGMFIIDYYLAYKSDNDNDNLNQLDQLVRVDVYKNQQLLLTADIFDLVWQLTEAPNGDHQEELFSLQDRCYSMEQNLSSQEDRSIKFSLETEHIQHPSDKMESKIRQLMDQPGTRNKALIRSLNKLDNVFHPSNIHNFRSQICPLNGGQGFRVAATMDITISLPRLLLIELLNDYGTINGAQLMNSLKQDDTSLMTKTFADCVSKAFRQNKLVLFTFCKFRCLIDDKPEIELQPQDSTFKPKILRSNLLGYKDNDDENKLLANEPIMTTGCKIFRLDFADSSQDQLSPIENFSSFVMRREIDLDIINSDARVAAKPIGGYELTQARMSITRIEFNNEKSTGVFSDLHSNDHQAVGSEILRGLSLAGNSALQMDSSEFGGQMDPRKCYLICLADETCQSYSICIREARFECFISKINLMDDKLLARLRKSRKNKLGKVFTVDVNTSSQAKIEFNSDNRCSTYNKRSLDMFIKYQRTWVKDMRSAFNLVANVEECARLCLEVNIDVSRRISNIKLENGHQKPNGCTGFNYINTKTQRLTERLEKLIGFDKTNRLDLCLLRKYSDHSDKQRVDNDVQIMLEMLSYNFLYHLFFKKQKGIRLMGSVVALDGVEADKSSINKQIQITGLSESKDCAKVCYNQHFIFHLGKVFICQSFDVVYLKSAERSGARYNCLLNSLKLSDAMDLKPELVKRDKGIAADEEWWHYEPQFGYLVGARRAILESQNTLIDEPPPSDTLPSFSSSISYLMISLIAISSGFIISSYVYRFSKRLLSQSNDNQLVKPLVNSMQLDNVEVS